MSLFRIEKDTIGEVKVPKEALWGPQTERSRNNFKIGPKASMPMEVVQAFATFRASVRDAARRKEGPGALFQLCDDVRNVVGPTIGWEFVDGDQGIENVMVRRK